MILYAAYMPHPPILLEEIGGAESKKISATAQSQVSITQDIKDLEENTDMLVIMSPHAPANENKIPAYISGKYQGTLFQFGRPDLGANFSGNKTLAQALTSAVSKAVDLELREHSGLDHGVIVPLFQLAKLGYSKPIVLFGLNIAEPGAHVRFGEALAKYANKAKVNVVFIGSGDMSHTLKEDGPYGFNPAGPKFDNEVVRLIKAEKELELPKLDPVLCQNAAECGYRSLLTISGIIKQERRFKPDVLSYEGPFGVGYLSVRWRG